MRTGQTAHARRSEGAPYRPPSEAAALILPATIGRSWNHCPSCDVDRAKTFRVRALDEVLADLDAAACRDDTVERLFVADGDALVLPLDHWLPILDRAVSARRRPSRRRPSAPPERGQLVVRALVGHPVEDVTQALALRLSGVDRQVAIEHEEPELHPSIRRRPQRHSERRARRRARPHLGDRLPQRLEHQRALRLAQGL